TLEEKEILFLDKILSMKFSATHATDANIINDKNTLSLFSRMKLEDRNIKFSRENHSTSGDIGELANNDFVFFSIEPGTGGLKDNSRFGKTIYVVDFDTPAFSQVSWVSLQEQYLSFGNNTKKHIRNISNDAHKILSFSEIDIKSNMFLAKDFKKGLALSLIKKFRQLPNNDREELLNTQSIEQFNSIINGIYRPEVKVPRHFFVNHGKENIKVSCGGGMALPITDLDNYDVISNAVLYNYRVLKYASEELKSNISIIKRALMNDSRAILFIHEQLEKDHSFAKEVINYYPGALRYFPTALTDNESIVSTAVIKSPYVLSFASERLRKLMRK
ncbi:DUF4116 domain-containing protein, partial [Vibrio parahaemolyticus]|nr:DUF4116 domain-containing protein [Vibrio parahaemolyticus]